MSTVSSILRSTQAYCQQLCEKETLQQGIAFYSPTRPDLAEANQFREVVADDAPAAAAAFEEAEGLFRRHGLRRDRWAPAAEHDGEAVGALLSRHGFRRVEFGAWLLASWPEASAHADVRVLPARAMRSALRQTFTGADSGVYAEACEARLDDPSFDMFVAVSGGQPAGRCALYQVGDFARVMELAVVPGANHAAPEALLLHALTMARRLAMRTIVAQLGTEDSGLVPLFEACGFVRDGTIVEFHGDAGTLS